MYYTTFAKMKFYYRDNIKPPVIVSVPQRDMKPIMQRLAEKSGVLNIDGVKVDLIIVTKILIEYSIDAVV